MSIYIKVSAFDGCKGCVGTKLIDGKLFANQLCGELYETNPCYAVHDDREEQQFHIWINDTEEAKVAYMADRLTC